MKGRSRPYHIDMRYGAPRTALAMAFNEKCDVWSRPSRPREASLPTAERPALDFLNSDRVLRWAEAELGI